MYTDTQIREYSYLLSLITDVDSLRAFWQKDPTLANSVENFNAVVIILEAVENLIAQEEAPTYIALVRYFAEHVLQDNLMMGVVEKNIKDIVPLVIKRGYLQAQKLDDMGIFQVTDQGRKLLSLKKQTSYFLLSSSDEEAKH